MSITISIKLFTYDNDSNSTSYFLHIISITLTVSITFTITIGESHVLKLNQIIIITTPKTNDTVNDYDYQMMIVIMI